MREHQEAANKPRKMRDEGPDEVFAPEPHLYSFCGIVNNSN
jgi:hypothetical protein